MPSNFAQEKKTKKIFAKNYFFTHCSISIFWRNGAMSKRKTSLVPPGKNLQLCQYTGHFLCENFFHLPPAESPVAGGWRMVFKGRTLDPDSNCNWVITKLSTLFAKLECEAFNSKVTFYIYTSLFTFVASFSLELFFKIFNKNKMQQPWIANVQFNIQLKLYLFRLKIFNGHLM